MNQTLVRSVLKIGAGYFIAKGFMNDATAEIIIAGLGALIGVVWGICHRANPNAGSDAAGSKIGLLLALALPALLFTGCAHDPSKLAFQAETLAATSADAAMRSYASYWNKAIVTPEKFHRTEKGLQDERAMLSDASIKTGASIELVENLRVAYVTNSAVKPQLQSALLTLTDNTAGIVTLANTFLNSTNK